MTYPDDTIYHASPGAIPSVSARLPAVRISLISTLVLSALVAPLMFIVGPTEELARNGQAAAPPPMLVAVGLTMLCGGCALIVAFICAVVFYCMWIYRACAVARGVAPDQVHYSPGWAVGWYFVPFANLVMPVLVMLEIWRGAHAPQRPSSTAVAFWWTTFVLSWLISTAGSIAGNEFNRAFTLQAILQCISVAIMIVSGVACLWMIGRISRRLDAKTGVLPDDGAAASSLNSP